MPAQPSFFSFQSPSPRHAGSHDWVREQIQSIRELGLGNHVDPRDSGGFASGKVQDSEEKKGSPWPTASAALSKD